MKQLYRSRKQSETLMHATQESIHESPAGPRAATGLRAAHLQTPPHTRSAGRGRGLGPPRSLHPPLLHNSRPSFPPQTEPRAAPARHQCQRHLGQQPGPPPAPPAAWGEGLRELRGGQQHAGSQPPRHVRQHPPQAGPGGQARSTRTPPLRAPAAASPDSCRNRPGPGYLGGPGGAAPPAAARSRARCRSYRPARLGLHRPRPGPGESARRPRLSSDRTARPGPEPRRRAGTHRAGPAPRWAAAPQGLAAGRGLALLVRCSGPPPSGGRGRQVGRPQLVEPCRGGAVPSPLWGRSAAGAQARPHGGRAPGQARRRGSAAPLCPGVQQL